MKSDATISSFTSTTVSIEIINSNVYKEVRDFVLKGIDQFNGVKPDVRGHELVFYGDSFRDAITIDEFYLSQAAKEVLAQVNSNYEYYDADQIIMVIPHKVRMQ